MWAPPPPLPALQTPSVAPSTRAWRGRMPSGTRSSPLPGRGSLQRRCRPASTQRALNTGPLTILASRHNGCSSLRRRILSYRMASFASGAWDARSTATVVLPANITKCSCRARLGPEKVLVMKAKRALYVDTLGCMVCWHENLPCQKRLTGPSRVRMTSTTSCSQPPPSGVGRGWTVEELLQAKRQTATTMYQDGLPGTF